MSTTIKKLATAIFNGFVKLAKILSLWVVAILCHIYLFAGERISNIKMVQNCRAKIERYYFEIMVKGDILLKLPKFEAIFLAKSINNGYIFRGVKYTVEDKIVSDKIYVSEDKETYLIVHNNRVDVFSKQNRKFKETYYIVFPS